jgi:hypothetical protein
MHTRSRNIPKLHGIAADEINLLSSFIQRAKSRHILLVSLSMLGEYTPTPQLPHRRLQRGHVLHHVLCSSFVNRLGPILSNPRETLVSFAGTPNIRTLAVYLA